MSSTNGEDDKEKQEINGLLNQIGDLYSKGEVEKAIEQAEYLAELEIDPAKAFICLVDFHENLQLTNDEKALKFLNEASKCGHIGAFFLLGNYHETGKFSVINRTLAKEMYSKAAGNLVTCINECDYSFTKKDYDEIAIEKLIWMSDSVKESVKIKSQFKLGLLYEETGFQQDARKYYYSAMKNGHLEALFRLGKLLTGNHACQWLNIAKENGHQEASNMLEKNKIHWTHATWESTPTEKQGELLHALLALIFIRENVGVNDISTRKLSWGIKFDEEHGVAEGVKKSIEHFKSRMSGKSMKEVEEMIDIMNRKISTLVNLDSPHAIYIEYNMDGIDVKLSGIPDIFVIQDEEAFLFDYKTGKTRIENGKFELQLKAYSALIMDEFPSINKVKGYVARTKTHTFKGYTFSNREEITNEINGMVYAKMGKDFTDNIDVTKFLNYYHEQSA